MSVVLIYLLCKQYAYARQRAILWFCKTEVAATPNDVSYTVGYGEKGSTVNINIRNSNESLQLADAASQSPKRALRPRVAKSYF
jgi:hypothetical protein